MYDTGQLADDKPKSPIATETLEKGFVFTVRAPTENAADILQVIHDVTSDFITKNIHLDDSIVGHEYSQCQFDITLKNSDNHSSLAPHDGTAVFGTELEKRLCALSTDMPIYALTLKPNAVPQCPPAFWKRWMVSLLGVYPLLIVIFYALQPLTRNMPVIVSLLLVAFVLTGVNARFVAPFLARKMQVWIEQ